VSAENVELIRSLLPRPGVDLVALFNDDSASGELMQTAAPLLDPDFVSVTHFPGAEPNTSPDYKVCVQSGLTGSPRGRVTVPRSRS
jgi:hypothetical protein